MDKATNRLIKRQTEKKRKLEESDIKYDFEAVAYVGVAV
jgi:nucleolar protein 15